MAAVTVRNLPDEIHRALKRRAAKHGRSTEAEIRSILEAAVRPSKPMRMGSELSALVEKYGGFDIEIKRGQSLVQPAEFE